MPAWCFDLCKDIYQRQIKFLLGSKRQVRLFILFLHFGHFSQRASSLQHFYNNYFSSLVTSKTDIVTCQKNSFRLHLFPHEEIHGQLFPYFLLDCLLDYRSDQYNCCNPSKSDYCSYESLSNVSLYSVPAKPRPPLLISCHQTMMDRCIMRPASLGVAHTMKPENCSGLCVQCCPTFTEFCHDFAARIPLLNSAYHLGTCCACEGHLMSTSALEMSWNIRNKPMFWWVDSYCVNDVMFMNYWIVECPYKVMLDFRSRRTINCPQNVAFGVEKQSYIYKSSIDFFKMSWNHKTLCSLCCAVFQFCLLISKLRCSAI